MHRLSAPVLLMLALALPPTRSTSALSPAETVAPTVIPERQGSGHSFPCLDHRHNIQSSIIGLTGIVLIPEPSPTATPLPTSASPANTRETPVSAGQPRGSLARLKEQGITSAILLSGDLLLLIVALFVVLIGMRRRPR